MTAAHCSSVWKDNLHTQTDTYTDIHIHRHTASTHSFQHAWIIATTIRDQQQPVLMPTSRSKHRSTPHHQHEKVRAHHARPAAATLASSPPTCSVQDSHAGVQGTAQPLVCVPGRRLPTCVCHWTPTTAFVGHRHVPSAANQHMFWRSLIRRCWISSMEQSANPAARVRHYTQTISTSTQNASIWSLTAAAPSDSVFLCTVYKLAYLLTFRHRDRQIDTHAVYSGVFTHGETSGSKQLVSTSATEPNITHNLQTVPQILNSALVHLIFSC